MSFLTWCLALALFIGLSYQAVEFHHATVCRQKAWEKAFLLRTRALLPEPEEKERAFLLKCKTIVKREGRSITWIKMPDLKSKNFSLPLKGRL